MKVLLLGGTKFIGPYVIEDLYSRGYQVTLFHRGESIISTPPRVSEMYGDRRELQRYKKQFRELEPDIVVDMNAMTEDDAISVSTVFRGIARRIICLSCLDVYLAHARIIRSEPGMPVAMPIPETGFLRKKFYSLRDPKTPEATDTEADNYDKLLVERAYLSHRPHATVLRLPLVYGPGDYQHKLYPYVKRMDDNRPFILMDRDMADWEYTRGYVKDVARAVGVAVDNEIASDRVYNVGEPKAFSELAWAKKIAELVGWKGKFIKLPRRKLPPYLQSSYNYRQSLIVDTGKIRRELGYKEVDTVEKKLLEAINWERKHPPEESALYQFDYALEDECANYEG